jgi:hypothetical protein
VAAKKTTAAKAKTKAYAKRADLGEPIDAFFERQKPELQPLVKELRKLVEAAMPKGYKASIKWGMPFYEVNGKMAVAIGAHKAHVNLILAGDPDAFVDPKGLLAEGDAKGGRHLKLKSLDDLPVKDVKAWLKIAVKK